MRIRERLKIIWKVLFAKNFAYFQYDRAEYWEVANITMLKNYYQIISPNEEDDINNYFAQVISCKINKYLENESKRNT